MKNPVMLHLTKNVYHKPEDLVFFFFFNCFFSSIYTCCFISVVFSAFPNAEDQKISLMKMTF